jgi:hypothetical protein
MRDYCAYLRQAAQAKGAPLNESEKAAAHAQYYRDRFFDVTQLAGYSEAAGVSIVAEWFPKLYGNLPAFVAMLESYEKNDGDP